MPADEPVTVGIVGCGEITSRQRADNFANVSGVSLEVAMDVREEAARDIGDRYDIPHTTDDAAVFGDPEVDLVYLSLPHHLHAPKTIEAAEAGTHVLVEKPIATTLGEADEMIDACDDAGVSLSVFLPHRWDPAVTKATELIDSGAIGDVIGTRIRRRSVKPESYWEGGYTGRIQSDWRQHVETSGGGILSTNATHDIDAIHFMTGLEADSVFSQYDRYASPAEVEDYCTVTVRYTNGAIGTIDASSVFDGRPPEDDGYGNSVYGTEGELYYVRNTRVDVRETDDDPDSAGEWREIAVEDDRHPGTNLVEAVVDSIRSGTPSPISGREGRRVLEVIQAAYRAGNENTPVSLPLDDDSARSPSFESQ